MKTKRCLKCKRKKSVQKFHCDQKRPDNLFQWCKNCVRQRAKEYYQRPGIRERCRQNSKKRAQQYVYSALKRLGGRCIICGCIELILLTISHENHDGTVHRKQIGSGKIYKWILNATDEELKKANLAVRCYNCNCALYRCDNTELKMAVKRENERIRRNRL